MNYTIIHIALGKANPNRQNGVNKVIHELASEQSLAGHHVQFWGISRTTEHTYPERPFETLLFRDYAYGLRIDNRLKAAIRHYSNDKHVLFQLHGAFTPQLFRIARLLSRHNLPYILTPHGGYNHIAIQRSRFAKKLFTLLFERSIVKRASLLHLIGASEIAGSASLFGEVPYVLIPNGQKQEALNGFNAYEPLHFGYVGRIDLHGKGLKELVEGFARFVQNTQLPFAKLHIVGNGTDLTHLESLSKKLGINHQIIFHGSLFGEEKNRLVQTFHALILPSRGEGIPGVVLESLSLGVPGIVSRETNLSEYIQHSGSGLTLDAITAESISRALATASAWTGKERILLGKRAQQLVRKQFNWKTIVQQFDACYRTILYR